MFWWGLAILMALAIVVMVIGGILYFVFAILGDFFQELLDWIFD